jgi:hypothetical protein
MKTIICIGDSHTCLFTGKIINVGTRHIVKYDDNYVFDCSRVPGNLGALAYHIGKPNRKNFIYNILSNYKNYKNNKNEVYVMFMFGESDCRQHIYKYIEKTNTTIEDNIKIVYNRYTEFIMEVYQNGFQNIIIWEILASSPSIDTIFLNKYSKGSTQERNKITKIFNEMLFQFAKNNDFHYLKIFDIMVDEELNTIVPEWFIDDVHLKKKCIIENYIKQFNLML